MDARNVDVRFYLRKRYFVAASVFISWMFLHLMRVNLSISIVDMTSQKRVIVGNQTLVRVSDSFYNIHSLHNSSSNETTTQLVSYRCQNTNGLQKKKESF